MGAMHVHDGGGKAGNASTNCTIIREICECNELLSVSETLKKV
jgi:hypothetical protein